MMEGNGGGRGKRWSRDGVNRYRHVVRYERKGEEMVGKE